MIKHYRTSSVFKFVGYNADKLILEIEFKNGEIYSYHNVPTDVFNEFIDLKTKGVRDTYFKEKIEEIYMPIRVK